MRRPPSVIVSAVLRAIRDQRFVLLGISRRQRLLAVMFAERGEAIRLISARRATRHERKEYEERAQKR
jgi:uncharacterized DUF497 family protein